MTARPSPPKPAAAAALPVAGCLAVFLALALTSFEAWEPTHDEGITWLQVFGLLDVPRWPEAAPIQQLYATLQGDRVRSAGEVVDAMSSRHGMHPPAYYLLLHGWAKVFGGSALALRLPGIVAALLTLVALYLLARRLIPRRGAAPLAMLLLAVSPWFVSFSNFARPYGLALGVALAAQHALFSLYPAGSTGPFAQRDRAHLQRWVAFAALSLLGIYLLYHYVFVFVWQLAQLTILGSRAAPRTVRAQATALAPVAAVALAAALGYAPWLSRLLGHLELTSGDRFYFGGAIATAEGGTAVAQLLTGFALGEALRTPFAPMLLLAFAMLLLATAIPPLIALVRPIPTGSPVVRQDFAARVFWLSTPILPASIAAADAWQGTHTLFITKTCFAFLPLLLLALVHAWARVRSEGLFFGAVAAWAILFAAASATDIAYRSAATRPYEAAAELIAHNDSAEHLVVLSSLLPGIIDPFMLTLESHGVREVAVTVVAGNQLAELIRAASAGGTYAHTTVIDFDVPPSGAAAARERFAKRALDRASKAARESGWSVARPAPDTGPIPTGDPGSARTLWIVGPLSGKTLDL